MNQKEHRAAVDEMLGHFATKLVVQAKKPQNLKKKCWRECEPEQILRKLRAEMDELETAMRTFTTEPWKAMHEAADVGAVAAMLYDLARLQALGAGKGEE